MFDEGGVTVSSGTDQYSHKLGIGKCSLISVHVWWTVTGSGITTPTLWGSNLERPGLADDTDWVQITQVSLSGLADTGSNGKWLDPGLSGIGCRWVRYKFAYASGTTVVLKGLIHGKS